MRSAIKSLHRGTITGELDSPGPQEVNEERVLPGHDLQWNTGSINGLEELWNNGDLKDTIPKSSLWSKR